MSSPKKYRRTPVGELRGRALWAYLIICILWGSTFIGIRVGVEHLPPFLFAGVRFLIAGLVLATAARLLGKALPCRRRDWVTLALTGTLFLASGNGLVVWAEQFMDAGTASIYVVTVAIWAACFDAIIPGGTTRFSWALAGGLLLGVVGMMLLTGATPAALLHSDLRGPAALVFASASWAYGTVYLKRHPVNVDFSMAAGMQMVVGGAVAALFGLLTGELPAWHMTGTGAAALGYLIVFGSIIGFTAYGYALRHASATVVGTYAYVNPVVAVLLGWLMLQEELSARKLVAMAVIVAAVLWIQRSVAPARRAAADPRAATA
jgi:drug/metabolite transporter (DMT)-like permease